MDIKELIDSLAKFDEMEAEDGMNLTEEKEQVDEATVEQGLGDSRIIKSDLDFGVKVAKTDDGFYFTGVAYGPFSKIYKPENEVSEEEYNEMLDEIERRLRDSLSELEVDIEAYLTEKGFKA